MQTNSAYNTFLELIDTTSAQHYTIHNTTQFKANVNRKLNKKVFCSTNVLLHFQTVDSKAGALRRGNDFTKQQGKYLYYLHCIRGTLSNCFYTKCFYPFIITVNTFLGPLTPELRRTLWTLPPMTRTASPPSRRSA